MSLSSDLVSQIVEVTKGEKKTNTESTHLGTAVEYGGRMYVKLDGSDQLTPVSTTADIRDGERVTVLIKNHTATVTGNMSSPSVRTDDMAYEVTDDDISAINAIFEKLKVDAAQIVDLEAVRAEIETIQAEYATLDHVSAKDITAINGYIESLEAIFGRFTELSTEDLKAVTADIQELRAYTADFTYVSADRLTAMNAEVKELDAKKLSAEQADIKYANIDFANITKAAIIEFFTKSGMIENVIIGDSTVTGALVAVKIKGDVIEAGTIKADKIYISGEGGLFYELNVKGGAITSEEITKEDLQNGLSGDIIVAKSITAEKVAVDDLVAFGATIGGFVIDSDAIHSFAKDSADNTTRGIYLDNDGQMVVGDSNNYVKYYKDANGKYRLDVSASSIRFGATGQTVEEAIKDANNIKIGARNLIRNSTNLIFESYQFMNYADSAILGSGVLGQMVLSAEED